ncbi:MAG: HAD family hydrolase [Sporichthyaceae bacterium]
MDHGGRLDLPRLVACDLDGTLLRTDLTVSERTRKTLAAVEAAGITLVFVTGRPPRWMAPVAQVTGHRGLAICANGATLYDLHTETVVAEQVISAETMAITIDRLRAHLPGVAFAAEYGTDVAREEAFTIYGGAAARADVRVIASHEVAARPAAKLMIRHDGMESGELLLAAREVLAGLVEVTHSTPSGPALLEVSAAGVSKATALARLCAEHGIEAGEVVAFGDMPNDLPMLAWAGRPYAMANAHPEVLAAVAGRAPSNDCDGVAAVLEDLMSGCAQP